MQSVFNFRLIVVILVSTVSIMSIFMGLRSYQAKLEFESSLNAQIEQIADRITKAVKPSIWTIYSKSLERSFSQEFASAILDSELLNQNVVGIVVYGQFGHIYMGKYKNSQGKIEAYNNQVRNNILTRADLIRSFPIKLETMTLGKLELFINTDIFHTSRQEALIVEVLQIAIIATFFVLVLYYAIQRALLNPMKRLQVARKTFESMYEAIAITNVHGVITDTNPAFQQLTGYDNTEKTMNIDLLFPGKLKQIKAETLVTNDAALWEGEIHCQQATTERLPVWLTVSSVQSSAHANVMSNEYVFVFQDISARKEAEQKLETLAFYDSLTGLANRQYFENELEKSLHSVQRNKKKLGVAFIDLDNFKHINDSLGHAWGDQVLVQIAKRFKSRIRESDFLARMGGDEFMILMRDLEHSRQIGSLINSLNEIAMKPILINDIEFKVGASVGIAIYPDDGGDASELIKHADIAMYHAKDTCKGHFSFYSKDLNQKVEHYFALKNQIDNAIKTHEFELYFQPKVELTSQRIVAAEALIRWIKPDGDVIRPDIFISVAEETRQIIPIGQWVIEKTVAQLAEWSATAFKDLSLSFNLSPIQLYDEDLISCLKRAIHEYGIRPELLEIEITESAIIQDAEKAIEILSEIKTLGIRLSLDDFGTGYSSLSYLRRLPVDSLKIDRSFLVDANSGNIGGSILSTIIRLTELLEIDVVAEGIEDQQHLDFLISQRCMLGQGYLFSKPVPISQFEQFEVYPASRDDD
jgi:diguanylate cyclase (GGDEF)-like protein/PAS domain S-box-containing protein